MRLLIASFALAALILGCQPEPVVRDGTAPQISQAEHARADSLMALPSTQLETADLEWLTVYETRVARAIIDRELQERSDRAERRQNLGLLIGGSVAAVTGVLILLLLLDT